MGTGIIANAKGLVAIDAEELSEVAQYLPDPYIIHYVQARLIVSHGEIMDVLRAFQPYQNHLVKYQILRQSIEEFEEAQPPTHREAMEVLAAGIPAHAYRIARQFGSHDDVLSVTDDHRHGGLELLKWAEQKATADDR